MRSALSLIVGPARRTSLSLSLKQPPIPLLHIQRAGFASSKTKHGQGYGDMEGDPVASAPRSKQPVANKKQTSQEHPGPEPVAAGKGKGGDGANVSNEGSGGAYGESPTSDHPANPGDASAESGGSRSKDRMEEHNDQSDAGVSGGDSASRGGAPIMASGSSHSKTAKGEQSEEVKKHNEEFEKRGNYDNVQKDQERDSDKVDGGFWQGHGGVENDKPAKKGGKGMK